MSTKLPKISAYIPQELYKCLQKDKQKTGMSLSQVIIAALANHYNLEETIGKGGRRVIVGGETSNRITALEKQVGELSSSIESQFSEFAEILSQFKSSSSSTNDLLVDNVQDEAKELDKDTNETSLAKSGSLNGKQLSFDSEVVLVSQSTKDGRETSIKDNSQFELTVKISEPIKPLVGRLLSERLKVSKNTPANNKANKTPEKFCEWAISKDPDKIGWIPNPNGTGYIPSGDIKEGQLIELQKWIAANS